MSDVTIAGPSAWPGTEALEAHHAACDVLASPPSAVGGLPGLLALPERGPWAGPVGRTLAICEAMPATLEPHGWRLALAGEEVQHRARRTLAADIEAFALASAGFCGPVTTGVLGPLSLAASVWLPVGERAVVDGMARGDLAASLALGVARHAEALTAARSDAGSVGAVEVVLHEPLLADVLAGAVPTFSGRGRLAALPADGVTETLRSLVGALQGHAVAVQVPAQAAAIRAVGAAAPHALQIDVTALDARGWEAVAEQVEAGVHVRCAVVPHASPELRDDPAAAARSVLAPWRAIGLPTDQGRFVLLPRPGVASLSASAAEATLREVARAALALGDLLA